MENISLLVAFGAGLLSFLSPCVLPLVPVYLASLYGPELFEPKAKRFRMPIFLHSLSFVIGFSVVFTLLGAGAGLVGFALSSHLALIRQIAGSLLIVFGLFLLVALKVPWLNFERRLAPSQGVTIGYLRSFLTGSIFSVAWTPCIGPILGGILSLALGSETTWHGAYLLAIYSLGLGLPFLAVGAAFDSMTPLLKRIHRYSSVIYIVSGVLLIAVGILILTNKLIWLQT
ncbi:MAG: cytochrome C biogenesis protein CcsB [Dehalococcoidia bacterium]|nr:MAG: cytochrome C biogenesis protein CcsB [Dehalococcoidia bacterium]